MYDMYSCIYFYGKESPAIGIIYAMFLLETGFDEMSSNVASIQGLTVTHTYTKVYTSMARKHQLLCICDVTSSLLGELTLMRCSVM